MTPLPSDWQPRFCEPCKPACWRRKDAMKEGKFAYDWKRDGWVFADYYKTGITYNTCPWCGGELPDASSILDALTDGSEGDEA